MLWIPFELDVESVTIQKEMQGMYKGCAHCEVGDHLKQVPNEDNGWAGRMYVEASGESTNAKS